jgi:hypothetical protein
LPRPGLLSLVLLTACGGPPQPPSVDADGDGYAQASDCDDGDASINPGAEEACDGVDNDCDGLVDDADDPVADTQPWYADEDGDGYGDPELEVRACEQPEGYVAAGVEDCDDGEPATHPGALELTDGLDNDCDGVVDLSPLTGADAKLLGEAPGDQAARVAHAGDIDGDGLDDILVGSQFQDGGAEDGGALYLLLGVPTGEVSLAEADARLWGEADEDHAGFAATGAGDTDGDGHGDLLVSAPWQDGAGARSGAAYLVLGPVYGDLGLAAADAKLLGEAEGDRAGASVATADVNGDGRGDLLVGADHESTGGAMAGAVYVLHGPVTGELSLADAQAKLLGEREGDAASYYGLAGVGDVDGDGFEEILVGAPHHGSAGWDAGAAYLIHGPISGELSLGEADARLLGEEQNDWAGFAVDGGGDVDGDGHADLLVGAKQQREGGENAGAAYLILGPVSGDMSLSEADAKLVGEAEGDLAFRPTHAGDVDGDGLADVLVGARQSDRGGEDAGAAYLLLGPFGGSIDLAESDATFLGETAGDQAGRKVARAGDVDGDGLSDLLFGAYFEASAGTDAGAAYLVLGRPRPLEDPTR